MLDWVSEVLGARASEARRVQSLWGGYGELLRVSVEGAEVPSVIVKRIEPGVGHGLSHERKVRSYVVEETFYRRYSARCDEASCRVPRYLASRTNSSGTWLMLEDLDAAGFAARRGTLRDAELHAGLAWLAGFHATFLEVPGLAQAPPDLWPVGTYWHLATRPDELDAIADPALRDAARELDARLSSCRHQTLVHGDAKLANLCFSEDGRRVAAVDFQYVGGGCGMKDLAYFLFNRHGWGGRASDPEPLLDRYFEHLRGALARRTADVDITALEREWRAVYPVAVADFHRFLAGWSPSRESVRAYRASLTDAVERALG